MRCLPSVSSEGHLTDIDGSRRTIRARAGLDDVRIHDIRRSFTSRALAFPAPSSWGLRLEDRTGDPIEPNAVPGRRARRTRRVGAGLAAVSPFHGVSHATGLGIAAWFAGIPNARPPMLSRAG